MAEKSSFMGGKSSFKGKKSSFKLFGKIEFPLKTHKKSLNIPHKIWKTLAVVVVLSQAQTNF